MVKRWLENDDQPMLVTDYVCDAAALLAFVVLCWLAYLCAEVMLVAPI